MQAAAPVQREHEQGTTQASLREKEARHDHAETTSAPDSIHHFKADQRAQQGLTEGVTWHQKDVPDCPQVVGSAALLLKCSFLARHANPRGKDVRKR